MAVTLNAVMAAGSDGDTHAVANTTSFSTTGITIGAGTDRVLVVVCNWQRSGTTLLSSRSVTWDGVAMSEVAFSTNASNPRACVGIYVLPNPAMGAKTLAGSWVTALDCYVSAVAFNGADQTTGIDAAHTATGTAVTINVTGTSDGATVASHIRNGGAPTGAGSGNTLFWDFDDLNPGGGGGYRIGLAGTNAYSFNSGTLGTVRATAAIHVIAASAGGSVTGTGAITLGNITVAGTGVRGVTSTGALTLGKISVSGSGAVARDSTGAITLGAIEVDGTAEREITSTGAIALGSIVVAGTGSVDSADTITGTGAVELGAITVSGTAEREIPGNGSITLGRITVAGAGKRSADATGAITLGPIVVSGAGNNITTVSGTGAITLGAIQVSGFDVAARTSTGAGSRKRRRRYYVEIDGQEFEVSGPAEAESLLARAKDVAQAQVEKARASPVRVATGIKRPRIETASPELKAVVRQARQEITELYDAAIRDFEIAALLAKKAEDEEEEALIRLLM